MLRWRLLLGTLIIAALVALGWLDHRAAVPGSWLFPVAVLLTLAASSEVLGLARAGGLRPVGWVVYSGNVLLVAASWIPMVCHAGETPSIRASSLAWPLAALGASVMLAFAAELRRYQAPGGVTANLAATILALVYVGVLMGLIVQIRMLWGIAGLASLVVVVKMGDIGAYTVGRLAGRHRMAPTLSPGKTIEGAVGGLAFACAASWAVFVWLTPQMSKPPAGAVLPFGWLVFGLVVGGAGMLGDLAESLLKRDVGLKDSSRWMPGFGGVLDVMDAILLAAPAAWFCWAAGLVGP